MTIVSTKLDTIISGISQEAWGVFFAIADTFIPSTDIKVLELHVSKNAYSASPEELAEFAALSPSKMGDTFLSSLKLTLHQAPPDQVSKLKLILELLSHRSTALFLTRSTSLLTEMSVSQREDVLRSWYQSNITPLQGLFRTLYILTYTTFLRVNPLGYRAMGHPEFDPHRFDLTRTNKSSFTHEILDIGRYAATAEIKVDVVIVGSGSGGGVVARSLAKNKNISILVIEKGAYYKPDELNLNEDQGYKLYEKAGTLTSDDGSMSILAGSTLGGGSTINWSASIRTPDAVRDEWSKSVPWYGQSIYDDAMKYVMDEMGCSAEHMEHSFSNNVIVSGSAKLGYNFDLVEQNTAGKLHKCGFCSYGCKFAEKQGAVVNWLRKAVEEGNTRILTDTDVIRIITNGTEATGVEAIVHQHNKKIPLKVTAKKVVVAGGSLQTPGLLLRSGFKNKNIGRNLTMHPLTVMFGHFPDKEINAFEDSILTAVGTEKEDIDGRGHGVRIEAMIHQPIHTMGFYPWRNGQEWRKLQAQYNHLSALMAVQRDIGSGRVYYKPNSPFIPRVDYIVGKADSAAILEGICLASDLLYIEGAQDIIAGGPSIPTFTSTTPVEKRSLTDPDFAEWKEKLKSTPLEPLRNHFASGHQMSTARLGKDPKSSVANERGQLWECDNVYIADASGMPSASGANPMVSVMATAQVISEYIREDLKL
ncbi:hypothetical protein AWJ20_1551 [Sugiyamaella lignohabitans]|uniref:Long-chain-alcohol oxidase n=1 Tax=Sugiyamaella lignohabitans TaxID=796027 RepID=A0A161HK47_9ASCO|nr:uncharacterized protein AWJ20_1551 [Sugiyamaella lignohabitans]ANB13267.1 hypothetical protein AWJ20_1551 [Sugiyamaella lignohabitans]